MPSIDQAIAFRLSAHISAIYCGVTVTPLCMYVSQRLGQRSNGMRASLHGITGEDQLLCPDSARYRVLLLHLHYSITQ